MHLFTEKAAQHRNKIKTHKITKFWGDTEPLNRLCKDAYRDVVWSDLILKDCLHLTTVSWSFDFSTLRHSLNIMAMW